MVIIDKYLNINHLKSLDKFERKVYLKMYEEMLDIYKNVTDDPTSDYYEPLIYMKKIDDIQFLENIDDNASSRLKVNSLSLFLHYYRNLIENSILVDKRELHIDNIIKE